jgi:hypothetical protein
MRESAQNNEDFLDISAQYLAANKDKRYPNGQLLKHALVRTAFLDKDEKAWDESVTPRVTSNGPNETSMEGGIWSRFTFQ